MRDRHVARLCRSCHGPMARQESVCWRCGAQWESQSITLRAIAGGRNARGLSEISSVDPQAASVTGYTAAARG